MQCISRLECRNNLNFAIKCNNIGRKRSGAVANEIVFKGNGKVSFNFRITLVTVNISLAMANNNKQELSMLESMLELNDISQNRS